MSPRSGSPTSARPPWSGIARPASRSTTRSSGRTRGPPTSSRELAGEERPDRLRKDVGLPLSTYFSGPKIKWILDNVEGARKRAEAGELAFGTMDTWVLWNLTGGTDGGVHATDVTNASRTMLMNLETLDWHEPSLDLIGIPRSMLPEIKSSSETYGEARGTALGGVPVAGSSATSRRRCSARPASTRATQEHLRHRSSCWSTPARRSSTPQVADHGRRRARPTGRPSTCSRARSR